MINFKWFQKFYESYILVIVGILVVCVMGIFFNKEGAYIFLKSLKLFFDDILTNTLIVTIIFIGGIYIYQNKRKC